VGDLCGAIDAVLELNPAAVVCIAGRNERARSRIMRRFADEPRLRVVGFTDRMSDYLAASDVLVHSTAGLTVLEALMRGCRVVSFGFAVGHVRVNDRAYERFGLARTARSRAELVAALREALAAPCQPDLSWTGLPSVAEVALAAHPRAQPLPRWRLQLVRVATATASSVALLGWLLGTDMSYRVLARPLDLGPTTSFQGAGPDVGLMVRAPAGSIPRLARRLHRSHAAASFVVGAPLARGRAARLQRLGDAELPGLSSGGPAQWMQTRRALQQAALRFGLPAQFLFAPPQDGFTFGEYLLAHTAGATPVAGAVRYGGGRLAMVAPGQVVEARLGGAGTRAGPALGALVKQLHHRGLHPVPVQRLWRAGRDQGGNNG
jgi:hypothetical protein